MRRVTYTNLTSTHIVDLNQNLNKASTSQVGNNRQPILPKAELLLHREKYNVDGRVLLYAWSQTSSKHFGIKKKIHPAINSKDYCHVFGST